MHLSKYISANEKVLYSFYGSTRLLFLQVLGVLSVFSALTYFYWLVFQAWIGATVVGGYVLFHVFFLYFNAWYFATNKKIYKRTGYFWTKIVTADYEDIADVQVVQGLFDKILGMGKLKFNTSGSNRVEIIFENIDNPFEVNRVIASIMDNNN